MSEQPSPKYRLVAADQILQRMRLWTRQAINVGKHLEFEADLKAVQHHLTVRPWEWGDPLYRLHTMGVTIYHAMSAFLNVHYGVDEVRRIVYLKDVTLMPRADFGPESPT
jgi:hypothetical protein